jgi:DnaJ-domain-containing protein 1
MGIPDRLYKIAKSYVDSAKSRWDEIDSGAQRELDETMNSPALSAWERAQAKIQSARAQVQADKEFAQDHTEPPVPTPPAPASTPSASPNALEAAYKVLGVPPGGDILAVQKAYQELKLRANPARFTAGSPEQKTAQDIDRRLNTAYMVLANVLAPASDDRFDRLEI